MMFTGSHYHMTEGTNTVRLTKGAFQIKMKPVSAIQVGLRRTSVSRFFLIKTAGSAFRLAPCNEVRLMSAHVEDGERQKADVLA